jgi:threonine synthase
MTFSCFTHLSCTRCGMLYDRDRLWNVCPDASCGGPLFARYHAGSIDREDLAGRPRTIWRWHEMMPVEDPDEIVTLGEGGTPLLWAPRLGAALQLPRLFIKDESGNPTGSFKARGMAAAISRARALGAVRVAVPTAGNAGGAMAAYAARAGIEAHIFMPADTPKVFQIECEAYGAHVTLVEGLIDACGKIVSERKEREGWFDVSTLKEPYRVEGKKTMGYELAEEFGWELPDVIVYPTGGGTGLIGMWKAFEELEQLGWIGPRRPKMVSVQASGCAPIVKAFAGGKEISEKWENAKTYASGLRVPRAFADFLILKILRDSSGAAVAVSDEEIRSAWREMTASEGVFAAPEGGAAWAAVKRLVAEERIGREERIVLFNTGSGFKYIE